MGMQGRLALALALAATIAACGPRAPGSIDDAALDAVADAVGAELNAPALALVQLLKTHDRPSPIALDSLQIVQGQRALPVDWWLWRRGLVQDLAPAAGGLPTFLLTAKARAQFAADPTWFEAQLSDPSRVDCESPAALEALGCEIELTVSPALTPEGRAFAAQTELPSVNLLALVALTENGWEVRDLRTEGPMLEDLALNALMGTEQARQIARQQALEQLNAAGQMTAMASADPAAPTGDYGPPSAAEEIAPVAPVIGESHLGPGRRSLAVP